MGGRGGNSGISGRVKVQSLDEYLGEKGLSSPMSDFMLDKVRIPHGLTSRAQERLRKEADAARNDYSRKRADAMNDYNSKVKNGQIRKPTRIESLIKTAHGHEDNPSVQAARRTLKKRGINWKTGRKL